MKIQVLLVTLAFLFFGCSSSFKKHARIIHVNFPENPSTLDPRKGGDSISTTVKFMLFEGLTRMSPTSNSELAIAKDVSISEDQLVYTFYLRDTCWSNGQRVTAHDFVYAWKSLLDPNFPAPDAALLFPIKNSRAAKEGKVSIDAVGVRALDDVTLEVTLENPTPYFLELVSFCIFFPVSHTDDFSENLTNGPFKIKLNRPHDKIILEKNPFYWDVSEVKLDGVHISFIDDEMTALSLYKKQELDFLGSRFSPIPLDSLPNLRDKGWIKTHPLGATSFCTFNVNAFPFNNAHIRKAFAYAMDRESIVNHVTQMGEDVAFDPIPPILKENRVQGFFPNQNVEKAREHLRLGLEELGIEKKDLENITFVYLIGDPHTQIVQALQHQWKNILDIHVELIGYTFKVYLDKLIKRDYLMGYGIWIIQYPDLMNIFDRFKYKTNAKNYPGWESEKYAEILNASMTLPTLRERSLFLEQAEAILMDEMPIAPIYHWREVYLKQPYVDGVFISPIGSIHLGKAVVNKE